MFLMEIDLELPICEQEKLDSGSNGNDAACDMHVEEQSINPPSMTEQYKEVIRENTFCCQDQVDKNSNLVKAIDKNPFKVPQKGLEFESKEAAYFFYREYTCSVGFGIMIKTSRRSKKSGKFIDIKIACSRFGSKRESGTTFKPRPCIKTDCKAGMHMKKKLDGNWIIYNFVKEHNHEICPDDFFRGRNKQTSNVAGQKKGMQLALDEGDVQRMIEYFVSMQGENPNFFYAIDLDQNRHLKNVFWVDSKGRLDYQNFHDLVFIDTFYMKNKYKIPFVPIVGVNNHFQYILLGCALVGEESVSAFIWLMRTWLKAMSNLPPKVIVTDQEKFLKEAVLEVFPDTHHSFCLWHILCKMTENLGYIINQDNDFMENLDKCIHHSFSDEQFEKRWWKLINRFELKDNVWVQSLYEDRKKWVATYMRDVSLAGLSTTARSESTSSSFDKYITASSTFKEFIEQNKIFSTDSFDMEAQADFETRQKQPALRSLSPFEKQFSTIYTDAIFRKVQLEIWGVMSCRVQKKTEDGANVTFDVDDFEKRKKFIVSWNQAELDICCSCHLIEYKGFLCRHAILVIQMSGMTNIPSCYILKWWTKDAKANQFSGDIISRTASRVQRFNDLCRRAVRLSEIRSLSEDTYNIAFQALEEVYKHCVNENSSVRSTSEPTMLALNGLVDVEERNHGCHRTMSTKKKKSCNKRECTDPDRINIKTPDGFRKRDTQTVDLYSRASTLVGYYGPQQNVHVDDGYLSSQQAMLGLGQLHCIPSRGPHYEMQHSMQGLLQGQLTLRTPTVHGCFEVQDSLEDTEQSIRASQLHGITSKQLDADKALS